MKLRIVDVEAISFDCVKFNVDLCTETGVVYNNRDVSVFMDELEDVLVNAVRSDIVYDKQLAKEYREEKGNDIAKLQ